MLKTIAGLQGVTILSKDAQKKVTGKGGCGFKTSNDEWGIWIPAADMDMDGNTKEDALLMAKMLGTRWCCDSCSWNR